MQSPLRQRLAERVEPGFGVTVTRIVNQQQRIEECLLGLSGRDAMATVFTTQLPLDHWSEVIVDPVIADAIRDRLDHAALKINITGESYRGVKARKLANKRKDT